MLDKAPRLIGGRGEIPGKGRGGMGPQSEFSRLEDLGLLYKPTAIPFSVYFQTSLATGRAPIAESPSFDHHPDNSLLSTSDPPPDWLPFVAHPVVPNALTPRAISLMSAN